MNLFETVASAALVAGAPGLIVDNFAGGGGASTGIEAALGRAVDIAINHDEAAIRMHEVNHPTAQHIRNNIWQLDPVEVTKGQPVELAWFSPDCKHFSKAKGGKPREKSIRDLAWIVVLWAQRVKPSLILLENVEEFRTWGPLDDEGFPIKERAGETFDEWTRQLRKEGYKIQWKELRACDYGAPTIRKRFFMIARCDGQPITWPAPTHGKPGSKDVLSGKLPPWRTAAEIIDWSIPTPSIFERKKPLADKTLRRIAHGIMKFVVNNPAPFIVPLTHHGSSDRSSALAEPLVTVTGANRGELAIVVPHITKFRTGAIGHAIDDPLATVTANSFIKRAGGCAPLGLVEASIAPFSTYAQQGGANRSLEDPLHTITASKKDQNCIVEATIAPVIVGCGGRRGQSGPVDPLSPFPTITAKADACLVGANLVHIGNGEREGQAPRAMDVQKPLGTVVGSLKHATVSTFMKRYTAAHIEQANGGPNNDKLPGRAANVPLSTIATTGSQQRIVTSSLMKMRGTCAHGQPVDEPLATLSAQGNHIAEVRAFLVEYFEGEGGAELGEDGLVIVTVAGERYVIVDIGMRMLSPRELFNAQGFPADYIIDRDAHGEPMTKTAQVAKCGNSVCPPIADAIVGANAPSILAQQQREAVAA